MENCVIEEVKVKVNLQKAENSREKGV